MKKIISFLLFVLLCVPAFAQLAGDSTMNPFTGDIDKTGTTYVDSDAQSATGWTHTTGLVSLTTSSDAIGAGSTASFTDFPLAKMIVSKADTGHTYAHSIAIVGEAVAVDGAGETATGIGGVASTNGAGTARGVVGVGKVTASADTGASVGLWGRAIDTHAGDSNVAVFATAQNGATNYSFYGNHGYIYNADNVGIGKSSPTSILDISGTSPADVSINSNINRPNEITANTLVALYMDGLDSGTTFTDSSSFARTITPTNAKTSTVQSFFGGSSGLFSAASSKLSVPDDAAFASGTNAFTFFAGKIRFISTGTQAIIKQGVDAVDWFFYYDTTTTKKLIFAAKDTTYLIRMSCPFTASAGVWYDIALVRIDNGNAATSWRIFVNGVAQTLTLEAGAWNASIPDINANVEIGSPSGSFNDANYFSGYMDEVYMYDNARYTTDFTPTDNLAVSSITLKSNDSQTGKIWVDGNDSYKLKFDVASTTRLNIGTDGNIGIGTAVPLQKVEVANGYLRFTNAYGIMWGTSTNTRIEGSDSSKILTMFTNGAERVRITSDGSTGIGTTTINQKLEVAGKVRFSRSGAPTQYYEISPDADSYFRASSAIGALAFGVGSTTRMTITSSGNVGIGTTVPLRPLHVYGSSADTRFRITETAANGFGAVEFYNDQGLGGAFFQGGSTLSNYGGANSFNMINVQAAPITFGTSNTVRATITAAGNTGIGTTNPLNLLEVSSATGAVARLSSSDTTVVAAGESLGKLEYFSGDTSGVGYGVVASIRADSNMEFVGSGDSGADLIFATKNYSSGGAITDRMVIQAKGNVGIGTAIPNQKLQVSGTASIGGVTSHSSFEADGTYVMEVDATVYDDIIVNVANLRGGGTPPAFLAFQDGVWGVALTNAQLDIVYGAVEIPHSFKQNTSLEAHVHWSPSSTNTGEAVFNLEYTLAPMDGTFGTTTTITCTQAGSGTINKHQYATCTPLIPVTNIGSILAFAFSRPTGDAFTGDAFVHSIGFHYEKDTIGSRTGTTK